MKIALTGDVMLGRLVDRFIVNNRAIEETRLWGNMMPLLLEADLRLINLECVISTRGEKYAPEFKPFHFRSHPRAIQILNACGVDCVNLANNHVLDYGPEALDECLNLLDRAGIKHVGAGRTLAGAVEPAILKSSDCTVALIGMTDNEPQWAAGTTCGVNYVGCDANGLTEPYRSRIECAISQTKSQADLTIVSAHVGPNWGEPSPGMKALAHQVIDFGADLYWGHSNHTPQGIELHHGKFIIYAAGNFIDDYAVDPVERNNLSFLFIASVNEQRKAVESITALPSAIESFCARRATDSESAFLNERMRDLCKPFNAPLRIHDGFCELRAA